MRKRITDKMVQELIDNEGYQKGTIMDPISSIGVVRLALDLQEARAEVERLQTELTKPNKIKNSDFDGSFEPH